ncbi:hypothetical protein ACHAXH_005655 [Discostella pseudostelligera]
MFHQMAQRWLPLVRQSTKMATTTVTMTRMMPRGGGGCMNIMMSSRSLSSMASTLPLARGAAWMGISKSCVYPSISVIAPNLASSLTLGRWNNYLDDGFLMQQSRGFASKKHKRVIRQSKGFRGRANRCFRVAIRRLEKSWQYAYRDRKVKKREFRKLWIQRLNAGVRQYGLSYSKFIQMQNNSGIVLDRKILSGLAMYEPFSFKAVVDVVKAMSAEGGVEKVQMSAGN